jgi:hypothetical protein
MSLALPTLQKEMKLKPAQVQWVVSVYPLSSVSAKLTLIRLRLLKDSAHYL